MIEFDRYVVTAGDTDACAKEFLRAKINAERAFEHFGDVTDHFRKYVLLMGGHHQDLLDWLRLDLQTVAKSVLKGRLLTVERMTRVTVLSVPAELEPDTRNLKRISEAEYRRMRGCALQDMGLDFKRFSTSRPDANEEGGK